ncbi:hypothetical protein ACFVZH_17975 [Streptomyces sp. NPDC059534]|uniref:hypothetical protein n=1 Tax=Streptomyces sp. NPDC059534 TaxID=3346859 RepID=UPI00367762A8
MPDHYPYRIATRRGDLHLIWRAGEQDDPDTLAVDDRRRLLAFHDAGTLQEHCDRHGWELVRDAEAVLDLEVVRQAVQDPHRRTDPTGPLLDAWNFFEDLARSVDTATALPAQGAVHDIAYDRFFDPDAGGAWSDEEAAAVRGLLRAGLDLWDEAARDALVPDAALLTRPADAARPVPPT